MILFRISTINLVVLVATLLIETASAASDCPGPGWWARFWSRNSELVQFERVNVELRRFHFKPEEAEFVASDPGLQTQIDELGRLVGIWEGLADGNPSLDVRQLVAAMGLPKRAPSSWVRRFPNVDDPDLVYARWSQLESFDLNDRERLILARALAAEPLPSPKYTTSAPELARRAKAILRSPRSQDLNESLDLQRLLEENRNLSELVGHVYPAGKSKQLEYAYTAIGALAERALANIPDVFRETQNVNRLSRMIQLGIKKYVKDKEQRKRLADFIAEISISGEDNLMAPETVWDRLFSLIETEMAEVREAARLAVANARVAEEAARVEISVAEREAARAAAEDRIVLPASIGPKRQARNPRKRKNRRPRVTVIADDQNPRSEVPQASGPQEAEDTRDLAARDERARELGRAAKAKADPHPRRAVTRRSIIIDANILIALQQLERGMVSDTTKGILDNFSRLTNEYSFANGGRTFLPDRVIQEARGEMSVAGKYMKMNPTVDRDSAEYLQVLERLRRLKIGMRRGEEAGGEADREIIADILLAERSSESVVPTFYTADSNIYLRLCLLSAICHKTTSGDEFFELFRDGFTINIRVSDEEMRSVRIVPVPVHNGVLID